MAVATVGAFALAIYEKSGDYTEAIAVMLFYQIGELFQSYAVGKSRRNISELMDIRPDYANIERDGKLEKVDPDEVEIGSMIVVQPGEKVPIDGVVLNGASSSEYQRADRREPAARREGGRRSHQRLHQYDGRAEDSDDEGIWRIYRVQNSGAGGKCQLPQIQIGGFYLQSLPGSIRRRSAIGALALAVLPPLVRMLFMGLSATWGDMDLPRADLPGHQLSLRAGYQHSAQLLCRYRRREQGRRSD